MESFFCVDVKLLKEEVYATKGKAEVLVDANNICLDAYVENCNMILSTRMQGKMEIQGRLIKPFKML
jgi:hypothetical protein